MVGKLDQFKLKIENAIIEQAIEALWKTIIPCKSIWTVIRL
jgi:hypothetical protein